MMEASDESSLYSSGTGISENVLTPPRPAIARSSTHRGIGLSATAYNPTAPSSIKRVIIEVGSDEEIDPRDISGFYQDVRMELNATGHNLTSVLINPRESLLEGLFDEFATDQSAPLDYQSPLTVQGAIGTSSTGGSSSHDGKTSLFTLSSHSQHSSHHSNSYLSSHHSGNSIASAAALYTITAAEEAQLDRLISRLQKVFYAYSSVQSFRRDEDHDHRKQRAHSSKTHLRSTIGTARQSTDEPNNYTPTAESENNIMTATAETRDRTTHQEKNSAHLVQQPQHLWTWQRLSTSADISSGEEHLRMCYRDVPELFFRPDFSLQTPEIFARTLGIKNSDPSVTHTPSELNAVPTESISPSDVHGHAIFQSEDTTSFKVADKKCSQQPDKLSYYLDLVEVALLRQIWHRSPAFFRALDDIRALQHQVAGAIHQLTTTRSKLQRADRHATELSGFIPQMNVRQRNAAVLQDTLLGMQHIVQGRAQVLALIEAEDYFSAMELLATTKSVYHSKELQLSEVNCMRQIGNQLDDLDNLVCEVMCNKFVSIAIQWDTTEHSNVVSNDNVGGATGQQLNDVKGKPPLPPKTRTAVDDFEEFAVISMDHLPDQSSINSKNESQLNALSRLLQSLILTDRTQSALNMYKARLLEAIRLIVRTCVMEFLSHFDPAVAFDDMTSDDGLQDTTDGSASGNDTPFAQRVREMSEENFLSCLSMCYEHVLLSIQKAGVFHTFMNEHVSKNEFIPGIAQHVVEPGMTSFRGSGDGMPVGKDGKSPAEIADSIGKNAVQQQIGSLSKMCLTAACDLAQRSLSQLLNLRKEKNAKLASTKMKFLWEISLQFVQQLEAVSGTTAYVLRQALLSQTKSFLDYLHESCKGRLVVTLDNERWVQCDVAPERQTEIDRLSSGKAFLVSTVGTVTNAERIQKSSSGNILPTPPGGTPDKIGGNSSAQSSPAIANSSGKKSRETKPAIVDGKDFKVVWSVLLLTEVVLLYLDIAFNFSPVTTDVINKIVELFRLFNNRARQLVLGAQAIQSAARLKSISAKHLAIAGQSLGLIIALLPHIRAALLAQIPSKHQLLLMELDRVSHEFVDHHGQIVAKFVSIVGDFVDSSAVRLREVDWDRNLTAAQQQMQNQVHCEYFEEVQRNVVALHRVLQATLPPALVQDVFSRIFALLNRKIPLHFEEIMPSTQTGRQRILDEVTHLVAAFSRLKGIDSSALTNTLEDTFRKRYIRQSLQSTS